MVILAVRKMKGIGKGRGRRGGGGEGRRRRCEAVCTPRKLALGGVAYGQLEKPVTITGRVFFT